MTVRSWEINVNARGTVGERVAPDAPGRAEMIGFSRALRDISTGPMVGLIEGPS
jgi:hypothetical protein